MSVYSKSMIERKGSGKTTIVERKWTLLALYCIAAAPSCPMLFAFCTKGPTLFGRSERRRARNFRTTADRSAAVRQSYSMRSDDAVRPPLLYCEEIRCSSAFFCPAAEWSDAIRPPRDNMLHIHVRGGSDDVPGRFLLY